MRFIKIKNLPEGFVIADKNLEKLYPYLLKREKFVIEPGEESKNIYTYFDILKNLPADTEQIVAFGGGVVGDLAGFVASTFKRGVSLIHVPTTLLAMVDSSVGGKTGANLGGKKNYVGTFYSGDILIDTSFLKSLPEKEFKNGIAEIVKCGILFGKPCLERLKIGINKDDRDLKEIIKNCVKLKLDVVKKDLKDKNYRHVLTFGHTIGHGIELLAGLKHGEAVSIGMVKEAELGESLGLIEKGTSKKIENILKINDLPFEFPDIDAEKVVDLIKKDKKGRLVFAFSKDDFKVRVGEDKVRAVLK